jgi:acetyl-CoA carboxylase biotin carboxyl carrier protein
MTAESTREAAGAFGKRHGAGGLPDEPGSSRKYGDPAEPGALEEREELLGWIARCAAELGGASPAPLRRITVTRGEVTVDVEWSAAWAWPEAPPFPPGAGGAGASTNEAPPQPGAAAPDAIIVPAPMLGTFYRSPEPGAPPFVEVGDIIEAGQQVGIVEAMKLMNAIQADHAGRVTEILASDGTAVEYGEALIALVPHNAL